MVIMIRMKDEKWKIKIDCEEWEFDNTEDFYENFKTIIEMKEKKRRNCL